MDEKQMLDALAALIEPVTKRLDSMQADIAEVKTDLGEVKKEVAAIKEDTADIREKANIYYDWTDRIELRVRELERGAG